jgi:hypothetical protein
MVIPDPDHPIPADHAGQVGQPLIWDRDLC